MIAKPLTYHDYDEKEHTKTFFFSINQTEFALLNNRLPNGFEGYITRLMEDHDEEKILDLLMLFIIEGYGIRESSDDFIKEDDQGRKLGLRFKCSEACDTLIEELLTKENNIWAFIIGMLPAKVQAKVKEGFKNGTFKDADNIISISDPITDDT